MPRREDACLQTHVFSFKILTTPSSLVSFFISSAFFLFSLNYNKIILCEIRSLKSPNSSSMKSQKDRNNSQKFYLQNQSRS